MLPALRNFAIALFVSLAVFGALAYGFTKIAMQNITGGLTAGEDTGTEAVSDAVGVFNPFEQPEETEVSTIQGESFNFVLVGTDYQKDVFDDYDESMQEYLENALTGVQAPEVALALTYRQKRDITADAILVGRVDKESHRLVLTALSGNTRVFVGGVNTTLGTLLLDHGIDFLCGKVTALTGFSVDYYGVVSIPAMEAIIDRLGGLSFRIPCDMEYEDPVEGLTISLKEGTQWLSGKTAMQVLRYVSYEDKDISRMQVLRDMAQSMLTSVGTITTVAAAPELYKTLKNGVSTNFSLADFTEHLDLIFRIADFTVVNYSYPGTIRDDNGDTVFVPDITTAINALAQYKN